MTAQGAFLTGLHAFAAPTDNSGRPREVITVDTLNRRGFVNKADPDFETKIVELFSNQKCEEVRSLVAQRDLGQFRPSVLAVVAYCDPPGENVESLFQKAQGLDPNSPTIVLLHAKYRWSKDPKSADELWQKLLAMPQSNASLKEMARDYLAGNGEPIEDVALSHLWSAYMTFQVGISRETNPGVSSYSSPESDLLKSNVANLFAAGSVARTTDFGSWGANYYFSNNRYYQLHAVDYLEHNLEAPITIHAGTREDLTIRPFGSFANLGEQPYQAVLGVGILGTSYRNDYRQSVQGSIFHDRLFQSRTYDLPSQAEQGMHFRFDYNWEITLPEWFMRTQVYIEHVSADQDIVSDPYAPTPSTLATITYSHTDIGLRGYFEHDFKFLSVALAPRLALREDSDAATYLSPTLKNSVTKRRQDFNLAVQPSVTVPLRANIQVYAWYEISRAFSTFGVDDYVDRNFLNQTIGMALRVFLSTF